MALPELVSFQKIWLKSVLLVNFTFLLYSFSIKKKINAELKNGDKFIIITMAPTILYIHLYLKLFNNILFTAFAVIKGKETESARVLHENKDQCSFFP